MADSFGIPTSSSSSASLSEEASLPAYGTIRAHVRGATAAAELRREAGLGSGPIGNNRLAELCGVPASVWNAPKSPVPIAFSLDSEPAHARIVLRRGRGVGRRFELARLLGDKIAGPTGNRLAPITDASTYRQQLQRSFAAEFLCPYEALKNTLNGDYSDEAVEQVSADFAVSPLTVRTLLANHHDIGREELAY